MPLATMGDYPHEISSGDIAVRMAHGAKHVVVVMSKAALKEVEPALSATQAFAEHLQRIESAAIRKFDCNSSRSYILVIAPADL
jgi:hypothetical protein